MTELKKIVADCNTFTKGFYHLMWLNFNFKNSVCLEGYAFLYMREKDWYIVAKIDKESVLLLLLKKTAVLGNAILGTVAINN